MDLDEFAKALDPTRKIRLALNVLYDGMDTIYPNPVGYKYAQDRFTTVMQEIHDRLTAVETQALLRDGFPEYYVVVRPLSLVDPPAVLTEILAAVRTLNEHGMLVQQPDALARD